MKKILITGNSGYIGSHLSKLLDGEFELYGLDLKNPQYPVKKHFKHDIRQNIPASNIEFDTIIHLAALVNVGESQKNPTDYYMTNFIGTLNVLNTLKCKNFVFASTGAAEGMQSPYGISKRMAEDCVKSFCTKNKIDFTIFRFYNVIGATAANPTNPDGLFYNLLQAPSKGSFTIYGNDYNTIDGTAERDYVHVNEICYSIEKAIDKPSGKIENLGHGVGNTVQEMVYMFKHFNQVDFKVEYGPRREGDIESSVLDHPSDYMKAIYSMKDLLRMKNV